jgi:hypothetical protein
MGPPYRLHYFPEFDIYGNKRKPPIREQLRAHGQEVFDEQMVNFAQNARNFVLFHEKWPLTNRFVVSTGIRVCVVIVVYLVQIHNQKFLMHPGGWR